jgi:hypothetical protein
VTQRGVLLALDSTTLATRARVALTDPNLGTPARISDDGTAAPVVGPDGRVFYGVLEAQFATHNARGWLLQFDSQLNPAGSRQLRVGRVAQRDPGFDGPVVRRDLDLPARAEVQQLPWVGTGDGLNRLAVLDPRASQADAILPAVQVMREVLTILGPTQDGNTTGRREWCINTMATDPMRRSILANNEDGVLYRWDLATNTLSQNVRLTTGIGQAYTPTLVGADGAVYAISNATLYSIRAS